MPYAYRCPVCFSSIIFDLQFSSLSTDCLTYSVTPTAMQKWCRSWNVRLCYFQSRGAQEGGTVSTCLLFSVHVLNPSCIVKLSVQSFEERVDFAIPLLFLSLLQQIANHFFPCRTVSTSSTSARHRGLRACLQSASRLHSNELHQMSQIFVSTLQLIAVTLLISGRYATFSSFNAVFLFFPHIIFPWGPFYPFSFC